MFECQPERFLCCRVMLEFLALMRARVAPGPRGDKFGQMDDDPLIVSACSLFNMRACGDFIDTAKIN